MKTFILPLPPEYKGNKIDPQFDLYNTYYTIANEKFQHTIDLSMCTYYTYHIGKSSIIVTTYLPENIL